MPQPASPAWPLPPGVGLGGAFAAIAERDPGPLPPGDDAAAMRRALHNALDGVGRAIPNPAVGCVVVTPDGRVLDGATEAYGGRHAERVALAQGDARGATLYATLEPCSHTGRQPPCVAAIIAAGVARCVVAIGDPNPLVNGQGIAALRAAGVVVETGLHAAQAAAWHAPFLLAQGHLARGDRPVVAAKWAQTLDGAMVYADATSKWITGPPARAHGQWLRQYYDAVAIGAGTLLADRPALSVRDIARRPGRQPIRVVFDPRGRLGADVAAWCDGPAFDGAAPVILVTAGTLSLDPGWLTERRVLAVAAAASVAAMLAALTGAPVRQFLGRPVQSVMVEGGPNLLGRLSQAGCIDLMHAFVAPKLAGSGAVRPGWAEARAALPVLSVNPVGADVLVECGHLAIPL